MNDEENFTADDLLVAYHNGLNEGYKILSDRIKEKIKELEKLQNESNSKVYGYGIYFLEELLKEE